MDETDEPKPQRLTAKQASEAVISKWPDPLEHFKRDKPWHRLVALFICKCGRILLGFAAVLFALKNVGYFH